MTNLKKFYRTSNINRTLSPPYSHFCRTPMSVLTNRRYYQNYSYDHSDASSQFPAHLLGAGLILCGGNDWNKGGWLWNL